MQVGSSKAKLEGRAVVRGPDGEIKGEFTFSTDVDENELPNKNEEVEDAHSTHNPSP